MARADITNYLVHWTKGDNAEDAFATLRRIVAERRLIGTSDLIKGEYRCICFTESPVDTFHDVVNKYSPFGIQVPKAWLFELGGRPVIYQTPEEYEHPENNRGQRAIVSNIRLN